jgi:hypothetical protein
MKKILIINHNAGFFSNCSVKLVRIINYFNEYKKLPENVDSSVQYNFYKHKAGDITYNFFKHPTEIDLDIKYLLKIKTGDYQFLAFKKYIDFPNINPFIKKYFTVSEDINNIKEKLIEKYCINLNKTIAILYRTGDKKKEMEIISNLDMIKKIKDLKGKFPDHRILVQSDDINFFNIVKSLWKDSIEINEIKKPPASYVGNPWSYIPILERENQAQIFLAIMQIIAKSDKIILNSGNVGIWAAYFRGNTEGIYQYVTKSINNIKTNSKKGWL